MAKTRWLSDSERLAWNEAPPLIRTHLWLSKTPPPSPDSRAWSMSREHSIWKRLVVTGRDPEELNGAIQHIRDIIRQDGEPLRLTTIYNAKGYATPVYEQARAAWIKAQDDVPYRRQKVPPVIRDIMRRMGE